MEQTRVEKEEELIFRYWKDIAFSDRLPTVNFRDISKAVSDAVGFTVGEYRLRNVIRKYGADSKNRTLARYAPENAEEDYTWVIDWCKNYANEFRLDPKRVRFIIDKWVVWAKGTRRKPSRFYDI